APDRDRTELCGDATGPRVPLRHGGLPLALFPPGARLREPRAGGFGERRAAALGARGRRGARDRRGGFDSNGPLRRGDLPDPARLDAGQRRPRLPPRGGLGDGRGDPPIPPSLRALRARPALDDAREPDRLVRRRALREHDARVRRPVPPLTSLWFEGGEELGRRLLAYG